MDTASEVLQRLRSLSNPQSVEGMTRFGIDRRNGYGVSVPELRALAREISRNHPLALQLWSSGNHEARILAGMVDDPRMVGAQQMDDWARSFGTWDVCDQWCNNLFGKTELAYQKAAEWSGRELEFVKRAGFVLIATLAAHDKKAPDKKFAGFLSIIERNSTDDRNFVKEAVSWALRLIGKRNPNLNKISILTARRIQVMDSKAAKWIASGGALRKLSGETVQKRLAKGRKPRAKGRGGV